MMRRRTALLGMVVLSAFTAAACTEQISSTDATVTPPSVATTVPPISTAPPSSVPPTTVPPTTPAPTTAPPPTTPAPTTEPPVPTTTECAQIVHIGDSTSVPLFDPAMVGGESETAAAQYRVVGVDAVFPDNDGGRSIIETLPGQINAQDVAAAVKANGYEECWVLMIGTNDAANIAAGASTGAESRIRAMMSIIGDDPVLWVDTVTQRTDDEYRNASMLAWNQVLYRVVAEYTNARVFRWYDVVRPEWFRNDGIHYTVEGSAQRARLTAQSLVTFFPELPPNA
jgi:lysophospholipase L1-like esterase